MSEAFASMGSKIDRLWDSVQRCVVIDKIFLLNEEIDSEQLLVIVSEILTSDVQGKRNIFERVMNSGKPGLIPLLEEFCVDFGFDRNDCFLLYLQVLLSCWQPRLNFITSSGRKGII